MIAPATIALLVGVGKLDDPESPEAIEKLVIIKEQDDINRLHWSQWNSVTEKLSTEDLVALVKALTVAEKQFHWAGGSVSAVIWVFRELQQREPELSQQVAEWITSRTKNPYAPYGTIKRKLK